MQALGYIFTALVSLVLGGLIRSWYAYSEAKGKNLATKEDLNDLKEQTAMLAQTTKEIESKIEDQVWNRQRHWELKRDTLLEALECAAEVDSMIIRVDSLAKVLSEVPEDSDKISIKLHMTRKLNEALDALSDSDNKLLRAYMKSSVIAGEKVRNSFNIALTVLRGLSVKVAEESAIEQYSAHRRDVRIALDNLVSAIRTELVPTSQSIESLAAQDPVH